MNTMNREQRRKYVKMIKHDPYASTCPKCKKLARFIALQETLDNKCNVYCELCHETVAIGQDGLTPRTYVKIKWEEHK